MKIVLSCLGTILIFGISLSAERSVLSYPEFEKQLAEYQARDQQLREQIAREQATILDVKNRIGNSRKNIDDLRRRQLETLGITSGDVDATIRSFEKFIQDISAVLNLSEADFKTDSLKAAGFSARLDTLLSHPACRLKALSMQKQSASGLLSEIEKRIEKLSADAVAKITPPAPPPPNAASPAETIVESTTKTLPDGAATYVVRTSGDKPETLFDIAEQVYGNAYMWPRIYQANKQNIDRNFNRFRKGPGRSRIADPSDLILPGQVLVIPR